MKVMGGGAEQSLWGVVEGDDDGRSRELELYGFDGRDRGGVVRQEQARKHGIHQRH